MKLNIGCGKKILPGFINIDKYPSEPSVVQGDLEKRIQLEDACADEILLDNVIEHVVSIPAAINEAHRLLKLGGILTIITPHYSSQASWRDPTHNHHLSFFSFDYFVGSNSYLGAANFNVLAKSLSFGGGLSLLGRLIFGLSPNLYEKKFCFIFPASTIKVVLEKK